MIPETDVVQQLTFEDDTDLDKGPLGWIKPDSSTVLVMLGRIASCAARLQRLTKLPTVTPSVIARTNQEILERLHAFPSDHQLNRPDILDPTILSPIIFLQNCRLLLHRHNLTPLANREARQESIDKCYAIARESAQLLTRGIQGAFTSEIRPVTRDNKWESAFYLAASAFLCTHIWRCTLFLLFRGDFATALVCARVSRAYGDARPINRSCGRYLQFFLDLVKRRIRHSGYNSFDEDEEMIAYVSGDLQGNHVQAWIWDDDDEDSRATFAQRPPRRGSSAPSGELEEWDNWNGIIETLVELAETQQRMPEMDIGQGRLPDEFRLPSDFRLHVGPNAGVNADPGVQPTPMPNADFRGRSAGVNMERAAQQLPTNHRMSINNVI
jgi:hypothetical protein